MNNSVNEQTSQDYINLLRQHLPKGIFKSYIEFLRETLVCPHTVDIPLDNFGIEEIKNAVNVLDFLGKTFQPLKFCVNKAYYSIKNEEEAYKIDYSWGMYNQFNPKDLIVGDKVDFLDDKWFVASIKDQFKADGTPPSLIIKNVYAEEYKLIGDQVLVLEEMD